MLWLAQNKDIHVHAYMSVCLTTEKGLPELIIVKVVIWMNTCTE